jgi:hypothetical protein
MENLSNEMQSDEARNHRQTEKDHEAGKRRFRIVKLEERISPVVRPGVTGPCTGTWCMRP